MQGEMVTDSRLNRRRHDKMRSLFEQGLGEGGRTRLFRNIEYRLPALHAAWKA